MIGFKLMVPWSTSGKAAPQKIQTETPPGVEKADGRATLARMTNPMTKILLALLTFAMLTGAASAQAAILSMRASQTT